MKRRDAAKVRDELKQLHDALKRCLNLASSNVRSGFFGREGTFN